MRLTVVGCSGSVPSVDSPASCYLVEADDGQRLAGFRYRAGKDFCRFSHRGNDRQEWQGDRARSEGSCESTPGRVDEFALRAKSCGMHPAILRLASCGCLGSWRGMPRRLFVLAHAGCGRQDQDGFRLSPE